MNYQDELNNYYNIGGKGNGDGKIGNKTKIENVEKLANEDVADAQTKSTEASDTDNMGGDMMGDMTDKAKSMATQMGGIHYGGGMKKVANPKGKSSVKKNKEMAGISDKKSVGQMWKELPTPVKYTAVAGSSVLGIILIKKLLLASIL
jgi:hypothetical protein